MKKKIIALILILLIAGICVFFYNASKKDNSNELTLYGNIEIRQVDLSFQVPGLVSKLLKKKGIPLKKVNSLRLWMNRIMMQTLKEQLRK